MIQTSLRRTRTLSRPIITRPASFFTQINTQMKADSPYKYEQFSKGRQQALEKLQRRIEEERSANVGRWWIRSNAVLQTESIEDIETDASLQKDVTTDAPSDKENETIDTSYNTPLFTIPQTNSPTPSKQSIFSNISANLATPHHQSPLQTLFTPKPQRNTALLYDTHHYESYHSVMSTILEAENTQRHFKKTVTTPEGNAMVDVVKDWLLKDERVVEKSVVGRLSLNDSTKEKLLRDLEVQQSLFVGKIVEENPNLLELFSKSQSNTNTDENTKQAIDEDNDTINEDTKEEAIQSITAKFSTITNTILRHLFQHCAKRSASDPMHVAWYKIKESGLVLTDENVATMLYVVSGMGGGLFGDFRPRSNTFTTNKIANTNNNSGNDNADGENEEESIYAVPEEVATYHDLICKMTESSVGLRVKMMVGRGEVVGAEELLEDFKKSIQDTNSEELIRLRTYLPIFKSYCEDGNVVKALEVFQRMKITPGVILEPENYCMMIATLAENGCFRNDADAIEGAQSLGYTHSHGPQLFDEIATDMALEVLEISSASARRLSNALAAGFKDAPEPDTSNNNLNIITSTIKEAHPLAPMQLNQQLAPPNELVASRILLNRSTGLCPVTASQQQLILLQPDQRKQLHNDLINLASTQYANYTKEIHPKSPNKKYAEKDEVDRASEQLQLFSNWLDTREGQPFTAIVDGANVGYYMQNFDKGGFNYHQIKFMVDTLEGRGENPLVVLPNKYLNSSYVFTSRQEFQKLEDVDLEIMKELTDRGMLYRVPPRCLDDLYWMVASVSDQTKSRKDQELSVPSHDPTGRFPGTRPMLITNDQMRDHRLELLEPRLFRRWYGCHIVNYSFTAFVGDESVAGNEVRFAQADFFSREIQGNECQEEGEWGGLAWHFPVSDWDLDERFVVRIPCVESKQ